MSERRRRVGVSEVTIDDRFWSERREVNRTATLDHVYERLVEDGRLENLRNVAREQPEEGVTPGSRRYRDDSDVYKWLEAASYVLATHPEPELAETVDHVVSLVVGAQEPDGYLNSYFTIYAPDLKWTNLGVMHELYCAGHLFEAAVAHHRATGRDDLLDVATKFADHIVDIFGKDGKEGAPGHPGVEMGLVRLYRVTGERSYLDLAEFFLDQRGKADSVFESELERLDSIAGNESIYGTYRAMYTDEEGGYSGEYSQDHLPVREQREVVGHAVMATYLYSGMAGVALETGEDALVESLEHLWENMTAKRMYVTGGIGNYHGNEGFTEDYDLPKETAYAETCAAAGSIFWNHRMLEITADGTYGDLLERTLYNALLAGISPDGTHFAYVNPLESDGREHPLRDLNPERFTLERQPWFGTPCCPPNAARLLASLEKYVYMVRDDELFVTLYLGSELDTEIGETGVRVEQRSGYPQEESIKLHVDVDRPASMAIRPRVPDWSPDASFRVNGEVTDPPVEDGFATIDRTWESGDELSITFEMPVTQIQSHPDVGDAAGLVALQRGPLVYCIDGTDHEHPLSNVTIPLDATFEAEYRPDLLDGITVLEGTVPRDDPSVWGETLYRRRRDDEQTNGSLLAIPYYAWRNRGGSEMRVWIRSGADG